MILQTFSYLGAKVPLSEYITEHFKHYMHSVYNDIHVVYTGDQSVLLLASLLASQRLSLHLGCCMLHFCCLVMLGHSIQHYSYNVCYS